MRHGFVVQHDQLAIAKIEFQYRAINQSHIANCMATHVIRERNRAKRWRFGRGSRGDMARSTGARVFLRRLRLDSSQRAKGFQHIGLQFGRLRSAELGGSVRLASNFREEGFRWSDVVLLGPGDLLAPAEAATVIPTVACVSARAGMILAHERNAGVFEIRQRYRDP